MSIFILVALSALIFGAGLAALNLSNRKYTIKRVSDFIDKRLITVHSRLYNLEKQPADPLHEYQRCDQCGVLVHKDKIKKRDSVDYEDEGGILSAYGMKLLTGVDVATASPKPYVKTTYYCSRCWNHKK